MTKELFFDLNIDKFLEHWGPSEAVRELIANAIDEQALTDTTAVQVERRSTGGWIIRDYGRGIRPEHLTQNEDPEKKRASEAKQLLGRFGVGLKDALATLNRHNIDVTLHSCHADIALRRHGKHNFETIPTLHAVVGVPSDPKIVGTEIVLRAIDDDTVDTARQYFLRFAAEKLLETTNHGQILRRKKKQPARIYIRGLRVAEEPNFLFSYNITALTTAMVRALNRERTHVGRTAYSDRVKAILLAARAPSVAAPLAQELARIDEGTVADELQWLDVQEHAVKILNSESRTVFVTSSELREHAHLVKDAEETGCNVLVVPERLRSRLDELEDLEGEAVRTLEVYGDERAASFKYHFLDEKSLPAAEREVWALLDPIIRLIGGLPRAVKEVRLSSTLRPRLDGSDRAMGVWEHGGRIVLRREALRSGKLFAAILLHEIAHARSDAAADLTEEFENALTNLLGDLAINALTGHPGSQRPVHGRSAS